MAAAGTTLTTDDNQLTYIYIPIYDSAVLVGHRIETLWKIVWHAYAHV